MTSNARIGTSGADRLLRALRAAGTDTIFTLVGDHVLPLCDLAYERGFRLIDTRHEAAAVHMADGYARVTGRVAICLTNGGPGHANAIPGLAATHQAESPVVHISGAPELALEGMGPLSEVDQIAMAAPIVKAARMVRDPRSVSEATSWAVRLAGSGRPGVIHLTVPLDVQEAMADGDWGCGESGKQAVVPPRVLADPGVVEQALELLRRAERPVAIAGATARFGTHPGDLARFVERTGVPLFSQEQARGLLSDDHPLSLGYADATLNRAGRFISEADVVLLLGKRLDFRLNYGRPPMIGAKARLIQVDPDPGRIGHNRPVALGLVGDVGAVVRQLADGAEGGAWPDRRLWHAALRAAAAAHLDEMLALAADDEAPIHPLRVARAVRELLGDTSMAIFLFDVGDFAQWPRSVLRARLPGRWHRPGPLGQLGAGLPMALGCRAADADAPIVLFVGDGGLGFHVMELDTAVRHSLPIVVVVGNDAAWGIDRHFQLAYFGRAVATELRPLRYDRLAAELGCHGELIERPGQLAGALERALAAGRPALIDVRVRRVPSPLAQAMIERHHATRTPPPS